MSSGIDLSIEASLKTLETLKQTASKFAEREAQLTADFAKRERVAARKNQDAVRRLESRLSSQVGEQETFLAHEAERIKTVYDARRNRVKDYHDAAFRNLPMRAREAKEAWMGNLEMRSFLAKRKLDSDLREAGQEFQNFSAELESANARLHTLEQRAKKYFGGYWTLRRLLQNAINGKNPAQKQMAVSEYFPALRKHFGKLENQISVFRRFLLPRLFSYVPFPILLLIIVLATAGFAWHFGFHSAAGPITVGVGAVLLIALWLIHSFGFKQTKASAEDIAKLIAETRGILAACEEAGSSLAKKSEEAQQKIHEQYDQSTAEVHDQWARSGDIEAEFENSMREKLETQTPRLLEKIDRVQIQKLQQIKNRQAALHGDLHGEVSAFQQQSTETYDAEVSALAADENAQWKEIEADWKREIQPIYEKIEKMNAEVSSAFPPWSAALVENWKPPEEFTLTTKFGHLDLDLAAQPETLPKDSRLALPGSPQVSVPAALAYPQQGSLLFETEDSGSDAIVGTLNNIILRLLAKTPPGKISFTIIDPVGLGQNFAGLMHLADYQESIVNRRIWTQRDQIEERLAELGEHIEKVIQMYLRNEYATITEYNEKAGSVAEKYHFLVVADFPSHFSDTAAKRLQSIAASGPRCGIFTLIHWDKRQPMPDGFVPDELRKKSVCINPNGSEFSLGKVQDELGAKLVFDALPESEAAAELIHKIGKSSIDSNRVEVPFSQIAPEPEAFWTGDTTNELRIPIGRTGATKMQYLAIGKGTRQHALFAGKTGSGKSTLFHVIITNLALACSPDQVEFYLIDFKKGVEFKCYATKHLPHAKVVAIESDREFALSVLQRVDAELRRRGDMFRKLGVQDIAGYKRAGGTEPMPRSLLIIDEFQEFFVEDDSIAQNASLLFDRIIRQGRAFGIHVLLGSQTLGGTYSLARATLGQMVIRVALQCNEADAYLIMDENNPAPRLLSRPGEGIYNDASGAMEANSPFQVVWLPDDERDEWLDKVNDLAAKNDGHYSSPIVFEGNAPADVHENDLLTSALDSTPTAPPAAVRCWLGAPNSIKGPTEAVFERQSGSQMLIVGQRSESSLMMIGLSLLALAAQYPPGTAKFVLIQSVTPGSTEADFVEQIVKAIPHEIVVAQSAEIAATMNALDEELKTRSANESGASEAPATFLFIHNLHKFKKLCYEDDFSFSMSGSDDSAPNPGAQFNKIITDGSSHGIHIIASIDTLNNINRFMNRKALSEFAMRVVFQMSANDSASLIDSPKASLLGLHRALFYNEHEGTLETFRPYAVPDSEWLHEAAKKLVRG